ncbi:MAG: 2-hydroxyacid dehydrogenase [Opitutaceae bacterium]|tara:strand:+ start:12454 stop:13434 length:981 start_codon:yes stop_codon:yes gene_type:complete
MSTNPVRIAIDARFAPALAARLTVPHKLIELDHLDDEAVRALLPNLDAVVSGLFKSEWHVPSTQRPLLVQSVGAGVDGISIPVLPSGSTLCNVYGHERAVAERAFAHMLNLQQGVLKLDRNLRQGNWTPERPFLPEVSGKNLLVLGLGHIGRELVRWGQFLDMKVTVLNRSASPERAADLNLTAFGPLAELAMHLPSADFVIIAIPSAAGTIDLISTTELTLMKASAFIINVGRGPVINEAALYTVLAERRIGGAGLDVWWTYPTDDQPCHPATAPFHELDNVVMTPHKPTHETMHYRWGVIAENIAHHLNGTPHHNVVWQHPTTS